MKTWLAAVSIIACCQNCHSSDIVNDFFKTFDFDCRFEYVVDYVDAKRLEHVSFVTSGDKFKIKKVYTAGKENLQFANGKPILPKEYVYNEVPLFTEVAYDGESFYHYHSSSGDLSIASNRKELEDEMVGMFARNPICNHVWKFSLFPYESKLSPLRSEGFGVPALVKEAGARRVLSFEVSETSIGIFPFERDFRLASFEWGGNKNFFPTKIENKFIRGDGEVGEWLWEVKDVFDFAYQGRTVTLPKRIVQSGMSVENFEVRLDVDTVKFLSSTETDGIDFSGSSSI